MKLEFQGEAYAFRSPGLPVFLRLLAAAHPAWVDLAAVRHALPGVSPRQLGRFVDAIEAAGLALVRYETKTRGPYRLAVAPASLALRGPDRTDAPQRSAGIAGATPDAAVDVFMHADWVSWYIALVNAHLAVSGGHSAGERDAIAELEAAAGWTARLPLWAAGVVQVRLAHALVRAARHREAVSRLRRVDTLVRQGLAHPAAQLGADLIRAKLRYDQGRFDEARDIFERAPLPDAIHYPHRLNMQALLVGRQFVAGDAVSPALLAQTLALLMEAIGGVMLGLGDTTLLDALTYNVGNNLIRGVRRGVLPAAAADTAMQWLAANLLVCRKLGIGEDSVLSDLLLVDIGLEFGYAAQGWSPLLRYGVPRSLDELLARATAHARKTGNRLEIAQCLRRKVRLAGNRSAARHAYAEAAMLFAVCRPDALAQLAEEWRTRFGTAPPKSAAWKHLSGEPS